MKSSNRIIPILVIVSFVFSYAILRVEFASFDEINEGLFTNIIYPFLKLCFIGIGVFSLIHFIKKKEPAHLITPSITFITTLVVLIIWQKFDTREASAVKLKAHYDGGIHFTTLILRANKTYKLEDYGYYGGTTYFGIYRQKGDTIVLSKKRIWGTDWTVMSDRLFIQDGYLLVKANSNANFSEKAPFKMRIVRTN